MTTEESVIPTFVSKRIPASELQVGDILAAARGFSVYSIREVYTANTPLGQEVVVKGPLNIVDKMHTDQMVTILNDRK